MDIVGLDKQADGGTHVRTTDEVGRIRVVKTENKGKGFKRVRLEVARCLSSPSSRTGAAAGSERSWWRFSGGADSAFLAWVAHRTLGPDALRGRHRRVAVAGRRRAGRLPGAGAPSGVCGGRRCAPTSWPTRPTRATTATAAPGASTALMDVARARWPTAAGATVVLGVNLDDLGDHRPGQRAAADRGRRVPARGGGVHEGRRAGRGPAGSVCARGTSRRPPAWRRACPYGTPVTVAVLSRVERAEAGLRRSGSARCACATTRTPPVWRCRSTTSAPDGAARSGRGGGARRRLPLRDARPRGPALGQPQPGR